MTGGKPPRSLLLWGRLIDQAQVELAAPAPNKPLGGLAQGFNARRRVRAAHPATGLILNTVQLLLA